MYGILFLYIGLIYNCSTINCFQMLGLLEELEIKFPQKGEEEGVLLKYFK